MTLNDKSCFNYKTYFVPLLSAQQAGNLFRRRNFKEEKNLYKLCPLLQSINVNNKNKNNMKEFLFLFRGGNEGRSNQAPEAMQQQLMKWKVWMEKIAMENNFIGAQPLTAEGKTVYDTGKKIIDGPFIEGKEMIGGYLIYKAESYDEAVEIAKGCPIFDTAGCVEVREIGRLEM